MNILYTLNSAQPGGMEQHVLDLVRGMSNEGHVVYVWCPEGPFTRRFEDAGARVEIHSIGFDMDPHYILNLISFLRDRKIDVLHSHELKAVINSMLAGFLAKTPVRISHTHTPISEWQIPPWRRKLDILVNTFVINKFAHVEVALTESRKRVKTQEGIMPEKLVVIPNALNQDGPGFGALRKESARLEILGRYNLPKDSYVFGNISRISKEKGHEILIQAYLLLTHMLKERNEEDKTVLFIGGGGPLEDDLRTQVRELGLEEKVVVTGRFPQEDHAKFYSSFDAFVFPTLAEGFGIVLIEAMSHALPVICSDLEVLQEVGGSTVRYFEAGNPDGLAQKMYDLYKRRDQYENFGEDARRRVEELFTMETFISKYLNLYSDFLNG